jgi:hypothetical protein
MFVIESSDGHSAWIQSNRLENIGGDETRS